MNNTLLDLSGKIDGALLNLFAALTRVALSERAHFFVVGAMARDLILVYGYGRPVRRATEDVDVGICVGDWEEYESLRRSLLQTPEFEPARELQRVCFRGKGVDLIPFGRIARPAEEVRWPPDGATTLSVVGFEEAYEAAQSVRLRRNPPLEIQVATPAGLALLKIIAWGDRCQNKDARDLAYLMSVYLDAENDERLWGKKVTCSSF